APAIISAASTTCTAGSPVSFTVGATGFPATTLSEAGADVLPNGVAFNATTSVLSGTPGAVTGGSYTLHFTAANGVTPNLTQAFTVTVNQAATITSAGSAAFTVGAAGAFTVTATGFPAPTLSETAGDTLPNGVSFNATTGVLSGVPTGGQGGAYSLHFTAHN